ncbi:MAG: HD domain-containing protein [Muribaculaceae bacterium]|nr:HD domain-containing protein [Muribaculaceae bacterium]
MDYQTIIDKYYPAGSPLRDIYMRHCRQVADLALDIADRLDLDVDRADVEAAAMLHDIGIVLTDAQGIHCHGSMPYIMHGVAGAGILREEGVSETIASVAERHTGAGITADDIRQMSLLMPPGDYMPRNLLERLVCYADKFYSKSGDMQRKPLERVRGSMSRLGERSLTRFEALHAEFTPV